MNDATLKADVLSHRWDLSTRQGWCCWTSPAASEVIASVAHAVSNNASVASVVRFAERQLIMLSVSGCNCNCRCKLESEIFSLLSFFLHFLFFCTFLLCRHWIIRNSTGQFPRRRHQRGGGGAGGWRLCGVGHVAGPPRGAPCGAHPAILICGAAGHRVGCAL